MGSKALEIRIGYTFKNAELLQQLSGLGGKIEGGVFPMGQDGEALQEIKNNWDSIFHNHYIGKIN